MAAQKPVLHLSVLEESPESMAPSAAIPRRLPLRVVRCEEGKSLRGRIAGYLRQQGWIQAGDRWAHPGEPNKDEERREMGWTFAAAWSLQMAAEEREE